jgi:branched-subunit amino acid ABC-type transport system permease component
MNVVNFAHGALYTVGAYFGFSAFWATDSFLVAILAAVFGTAILGVVMEMTVIRPIYERDILYQIPVTFGAAIIIVQGIYFIWDGEPKQFPIPDTFSGTFSMLGTSLGVYRLFLIVVGTVLVAALLVFLNKTKYGMIVRAAITDTEMVESMGYNVALVYTFLFAIGAAYAGIGGILISPLFGLFPEMGTNIIIIAFIIVVVGGLGSVKGAITAGLLIGVLQSFGRLYVPTYAEVIPLVIMVGVLLVRPQGLFGARGGAH